MSRAEISLLMGFAFVFPFAGAVLLAIAGGQQRARRFLAVVYAAGAVGIGLALMSGYLQNPARGVWGPIKFSSFSFPAFLIMNLLGVAGVLYAGFRSSSVKRPGVLTASIAAACGFGALALVVTTLLPLVGLWLGASVAALIGLLTHGGDGLRRRLRAFVPWIVSDGLLVLGAVLCYVWLKETSILIKPPLTAGSEAAVVTVVALFLASALIRLGVFPLHFWVGDLTGRTDPSWSSFYLGGLNLLLAGSRLVIAITLLGRLVASDWGLALAVAGLVSIAAGPLIAATSKNVRGTVAGMYCLQSGFLLFSLALFSRAGLESGLFLLLTAPLFMTAFLMAVGTAADLRGTGVLGEQLIAARAAPAALVVMLFTGMALVGLPPTDGFIGKSMAVLASLDKSVATQFYALAMAIALAALAVALLGVLRLLGGTFTGDRPGAALRRSAPFEGAVPLALCGVSLLIGLFPGLLLGNFLRGASRLLIAAGFQGPGVAFRGTGDPVSTALNAYPVWAPVVVAVFLVLLAVVLVSYFSSRAAHPSEGPAGRKAPFVGGAQGTFSSSWPAMERSRAAVRMLRRPGGRT